MKFVGFRATVLCVRAMCVGLLAASVVPIALADITYPTGTVTYIQAATQEVGCIYFQLSGVTQADPAVPNNAWFAIPDSHPGYTQIYAMLLEVKATGGTVSVTTTGVLAGGACGNYVGVDHVIMN